MIEITDYLTLIEIFMNYLVIVFILFQAALQNGRIPIGQGLRQDFKSMCIGPEKNNGSCKEKRTLGRRRKIICTSDYA